LPVEKQVVQTVCWRREEDETALSPTERRALIARGGAVLAVVASIVVVVLLITGGGGGGYEISARFENASQLVNGSSVTVAGTRAGQVKEIKLANDGGAIVEMEIDDDVAPVYEGTTATVRSSWVSGIATRQVELNPPPAAHAGPEIANGGELPESSTVSEVDIDQLFNTLDEPTVTGLKKTIEGLNGAYSGVGKQANAGIHYLNPLLSTSRRLVGELQSDQADLGGFVVDASRLSGALAERAPQVSALVRGLDRSMTAVGSERDALQKAIGGLPAFLRQFDTTAFNLRAALDDLDPLVTAAKPLAKRLQPFFADFRHASADLIPTVRGLDTLVERPGATNDLVDLTRSLTPLGQTAVGPSERNGAVRDGAIPETAKALEGSLPIISFFRPYTPELVGWMDDFGHSGIYDANGAIGRIHAVGNTFSASTAGLPLVTGVLQSAGQQTDLLDLFNNARCPGALERDPGDGSTPFTDGGNVDCNPAQVPTGP
jgi:phospholipid/cholesterol/gamma-HCH transport system substrate-binding protein